MTMICANESETEKEIPISIVLVGAHLIGIFAETVSTSLLFLFLLKNESERISILGKMHANEYRNLGQFLSIPIELIFIISPKTD